MSDMKCPFCGEKLQQTFSFNPKQFWCSNYYDHKHPINLQGTKELWQELIRTRKALDVAVDALKNIFDYSKIVSSELQKNHLSQFQTPINKMQYSAQQALKQITALEQKD